VLPLTAREHDMGFDPPDEESAASPNGTRAHSADSLREQAAACRRLAAQARTPAGKNGLDALGDHFDEQARKIDSSSLRR
jgi:hypothetical protein